MPSKTCTKCSEEKELSAFYKDRTKSDGKSSSCKACMNAVMRARRERLKKIPKPQISQKTCCTCNEVKAAEGFYKNATSVDGYNNQCKQCHLDYYKSYYQENSDKKKKIARTWYAENKEQAAERVREWRAQNPDLVRSIQNKHRAKKAKALIADFTEAQWQQLLEANGERCAYCGTEDTEICRDHAVPLAVGGDHTLTNIVPSCRVCNSRKHTKTTLEFLIENAAA